MPWNLPEELNRCHCYISPEFSVTGFIDNSYDVNESRRRLRNFISRFLLIADESHVFGLDEASNYRRFCGNAPGPGNEIAEFFAVWLEKRAKLIEAANKTLECLSNPGDVKAIVKTWTDELSAFNKGAAEINQQVGSRAAAMLRSWFETGEISIVEPVIGSQKKKTDKKQTIEQNG